MKKCISCGMELAENTIICPSCNANQISFFDEFEPQPVYNDIFLKVLCWLTIVGASFSLISVTATMSTGEELPIAGMKQITWMGVVIAIGKCIGAIFMLRKKLTGLYIYTAAAIFAIVVQLYSFYLTREYIATISKGNEALVLISSMAGILFLLAFLVMYWLPVNRRVLS